MKLHLVRITNYPPLNPMNQYVRIKFLKDFHPAWVKITMVICLGQVLTRGQSISILKCTYRHPHISGMPNDAISLGGKGFQLASPKPPLLITSVKLLGVALESLRRRAFTPPTHSIDSAAWLEGVFSASHAEEECNCGVKASILVCVFTFGAICSICYIGATIILISTLKYYEHLNFRCPVSCG